MKRLSGFINDTIRETVVADTEQDFAIDFSERISAALLSTADRVIFDIKQYLSTSGVSAVKYRSHVLHLKRCLRNMI
ncbi:Uncharacterised protein [Staphylococcus aureus]|nr:Uncharacterised protein [Staphylococcus aureus]